MSTSDFTSYKSSLVSARDKMRSVAAILLTVRCQDDAAKPKLTVLYLKKFEGENRDV